MNELQIACIPLAIYLVLVIGAYIHTKYQKKGTVKNVNNWVKRLKNE